MGLRQTAGLPLPTSVTASLENRVLHWTDTEETSSQGSNDPANGKPILGEIWEQTDAAGTVVTFHGRWTMADGSLHQEIVEAAGKQLLVLGPAYQAGAAAPPSACSIANLSGAHRLVDDQLFADPATLPQLGFQPAVMAPSAGGPLPATVPPSGVAPAQVYPTGSTGQTWSSRQSKGGETETRTLQISPNGRLASAQAQRTDAQGRVISAFRVVLGALEVYAPTAVPASVFALSPAAQGICHA